MVKKLCACAEREIREKTGNYGERYTVVNIARAPVAPLGGLAPIIFKFEFVGKSNTVVSLIHVCRIGIVYYS